MLCFCTVLLLLIVVVFVVVAALLNSCELNYNGDILSRGVYEAVAPVTLPDVRLLLLFKVVVKVIS